MDYYKIWIVIQNCSLLVLVFKTLTFVFKTIFYETILLPVVSQKVTKSTKKKVIKLQSTLSTKEEHLVGSFLCNLDKSKVTIVTDK